MDLNLDQYLAPDRHRVIFDGVEYVLKGVMELTAEDRVLFQSVSNEGDGDSAGELSDLSLIHI